MIGTQEAEEEGEEEEVVSQNQSLGGHQISLPGPHNYLSIKSKVKVVS